MVRKSFSMIELIVTIVIIAITISTLPKVMDTASKSIEKGISQEAIWFGAEALYNELSKEFNETEDFNTSVSKEGRLGYKNDYDVNLTVTKNFNYKKETNGDRVRIDLNATPTFPTSNENNLTLLEVNISSSTQDVNITLFAFDYNMTR